MLEARTACQCHAAHLTLQAETGGEHDRDAGERNQYEPAPDERDERQEQDQEAEVDDQHDGRGGKESRTISYSGCAGRARRCCRRGPSEGSSPSRIASGEISRRACADPSTSANEQAQGEVEREREQNTERKHPQGRDRLVRAYPVVDVDGEQRHREGQQIDDQGGEQHRPEFTVYFPCFGPEPMVQFVVPRSSSKPTRRANARTSGRGTRPSAATGSGPKCGRSAREFWPVLLAALIVNLLALGDAAVHDERLRPGHPQQGGVDLVGAGARRLLALAFDFILRMARSQLIDEIGRRLDAKLSQKLFEKVMNLPMADRQGSTGAFARRVAEYEWCATSSPRPRSSWWSTSSSCSCS